MPHHPAPLLLAALLFDGDRIACLSAMLLKDMIGQLPGGAAAGVRVGIIQTAYANGAASRYIRDNLGCDVEVGGRWLGVVGWWGGERSKAAQARAGSAARHRLAPLSCTGWLHRAPHVRALPAPPPAWPGPLPHHTPTHTPCRSLAPR